MVNLFSNFEHEHREIISTIISLLTLDNYYLDKDPLMNGIYIQQKINKKVKQHKLDTVFSSAFYFSDIDYPNVKNSLYFLDKKGINWSFHMDYSDNIFLHSVGHKLYTSNPYDHEYYVNLQKNECLLQVYKKLLNNHSDLLAEMPLQQSIINKEYIDLFSIHHDIDISSLLNVNVYKYYNSKEQKEFFNFYNNKSSFHYYSEKIKTKIFKK